MFPLREKESTPGYGDGSRLWPWEAAGAVTEALSQRGPPGAICPRRVPATGGPSAALARLSCTAESRPLFLQRPAGVYH